MIASQGAQRKEKPGGKITARVLFDGTHGLCVNTRTRLRDQERAPIAADLKRTTREKAKLDELTFALSADVSEAHRQVPIHPDDWHLLGCQVISGREVFINTGGTLSIASASYYWSRVAGAVGRLAQYLIGDSATTWHMLVADDYLLECGGPAYRRGLLTFFENLFMCSVLGVPLSWHKTSGGDVLVWVGFELLLRSRCVGISARRAEWFVRWTQKIADSDTVNMASFEEGQGRIMFVAGALEHERPFLGPSLKVHQHTSKGIDLKNTSVCEIHPPLSCKSDYEPETLPMQFEVDDGGLHAPVLMLRPAHNAQGLAAGSLSSTVQVTLDPWLSSWFSLEISKCDVPWIFEKGDKPTLVISTLEALAILVALKLRFGNVADTEDKRVLIVPSVTDNRGNGAALNKLMSTRFPSSAVLMELATFMKARRLRTIVEWAPREYNRMLMPSTRKKDSHVGYLTRSAGGRQRGRTSFSREEGFSRAPKQVQETTLEEGRDGAQDDRSLVSAGVVMLMKCNKLR